jgi:hypothetical protein
MSVVCEVKVCRRSLWVSDSSNTPLEWTGHHQLSAKETLIKPSLSGDICLVLANETTMCRFDLGLQR